jgi:gliding motility-associated-like protein
VQPNNSVKISWHWDLNSRVKQFEVWRSTNKAPAVRIVTVNSDSTYTDRFALPQYNDQAYYVIGIDSCSSLDRSAPSVTDSISRIHLSTGGCYAQVVLNWSAYYQLPGGTDAYEVYRSVNRGAFTKIAIVTGLTYTDASVDSLHCYAYEVKAISNSNSLYSFSDSASIVPWVYPLPGIVNLAYSTVQRTDAGSGAIRLNWNRYNFLKDTFARGYRLYHSTNINGPYTVVLDTQSRFISSYVHRGINTVSQPHFYFLKVYNLCNREGDSNRIHSPAKLSLQNRNGEVAVYWKKYNGFDSVKNSAVYRSDNGGSFKLMRTVAGNMDSLIDTNVYCGHQYSYRIGVQSADLKVPLSYSDSESVTAFDTIPPAVPVLQFATTDATGKTNGRITLSFLGNSDKNRSGYKVYISADGINYTLADTFKRTRTDTLVYQQSGLNTSNTAYSFYVTAIDSCGNASLASDTQTVVNLKAIAKNEANVLHWSAYRGFKQYSYTIERKTRNTQWVQLITLDKSIFDYHDSATICDTQYTYRIVTTDSIDHFISLSNTDSAIAFETDSPAAPVIVNATVLQTGTANGVITLNWKHSKGRRIDYYNLYRYDEATRKWMLLATKLRTLSYNDSSLNTYRTAYRYRLEVVDSCGNPSRGYSVPHQSMVLRAAAANQAIKLRWSAYAGWPVSYYDIYRDGALLKRLNGTDTTYKDTPAQCPVLYHYTVLAIDANDSTVLSVSNQDSARPYDNIPPHKPYLVRATVSQPNNQVALEWTRSQDYDAKGYMVMRKTPPNTWFDLLYKANSIDDTAYTDTMHSAIRQQYCYQVKTFDHCGNISDSSNEGCIILAQGEAKSLANVLQWNGYQHWPEGVAYYNIYRKTDTSAGYQFLQRFDKPVLMYTDTGIEDDAVKYCYRIEAVEKGGFTAGSWSTELCLVQAPVVWIPDAFTPVASYNINDLFGPRGLFIGRYDMEIFNRWGQDIYSTNESRPWDGNAFGKPAPDGLYLYNITVYDHNGQKYYFKGTVVLLK